MKFKEESFIPVLFGNDINVYSVARAFYEEYKVQSKGFGKVKIGTCYRSKLLDYDKVERLDDVKVISKVVNDFAMKHQDKKILVIGCGDSYVKALATGRENFPSNVIVPYADYEFLNSLMDKERFYELCEKHGIDYPKTHIVSKDDYDKLELSFTAPYILKPANQVMYYEKKFEGQKKVFLLDTFEELKETLKKTYDAGYTDHMIIQEFVPGDDTNMRVLTSYSDRHAKVRMMCLGHVLLEDINYTGFSNFDIKYDPRDQKYKAFEINTRQGRSNFYVTGSGHNVAKLFVEDFVYNREIPMDISKDEHLWMVVPKGVAFKYAPSFKKKMKELIRAKKYVNPLWFREDKDLERVLRLIKSQLGHFKKFKKYLGKK